MELEFRIRNQELIREDNIKIVNKLRNYLTCKFFFETDEWNNIEKYVIFKDEVGKAYQFRLKSEDEYSVIVPHEVLNRSLFKVTVYGGDLLTTNEKTVLLSESGYTDEICKINPNVRDVFTEGFHLINSKLNDVTYEDNILNFYVNDKLVQSFELVDDSMVDKILSDDIIIEIQNTLEHKADEIHTHIIDDITDFEDKNYIDIRQAYLSLANKIRSYGE